jgi:hypothetical protein
MENLNQYKIVKIFEICDLGKRRLKNVKKKLLKFVVWKTDLALFMAVIL